MLYVRRNVLAKIPWATGIRTNPDTEYSVSGKPVSGNQINLLRSISLYLMSYTVSSDTYVASLHTPPQRHGRRASPPYAVVHVVLWYSYVKLLRCMSVWSMRMVQPRRGGDAPRRGPIPFSPVWPIWFWIGQSGENSYSGQSIFHD